MSKKINLEEIFEKKNPQDGKLPEWAKQFALEFGKQLLELAAENVGFVETTSEKLNSEDYVPFIRADDDTMWSFDKQSILDTINQIK